ncbi:MAG: DUF4388 domain-containing protein [Acidobacteriota bacterium]
MRLDGRLEDFDVLEVLQAALRRVAPAQLLMADDEREGQLRLEAGFIIDARLGEVTGEEALFDMLSWRNGFFSLSSAEMGHAEDEETLRWTWSQLLRQAFRRAAQSQIGEVAPLSEADIQLLEQDLSLLFQNLGSDIARLADERCGAIPLLESLCEMVNMSVSLSPEQAKRHEFQLLDVLPRHGWKGSGLSFIQLEDTLINSRAVGQVYAAAAFDPESRRLEARATARMLGSSLDEILTRLAKLLPATDSSRQAMERGRALTTDIQALIRACSF